MDRLQIWQDEAGNLTNFTPGSGFAGGHTNYLVYDLDAGGDHWVALDASNSSGSGQSDVRLFIPDSLFINDAQHRYVTLYSAFGLQGDGWATDGGSEDWGLRSTTAGGGGTPAFTISKVASAPGGTAHVAGEVISYTITLTNVGDTSLTSVTLTDPLLQGPNGTLGTPTESLSSNGVLDVGETWTYSGTYTVQQSDIDNFASTDGAITNTATADTAQASPLSASAVVTLEYHATLGLTKSGTWADNGGHENFADPGETISYTFTVTNTGNVTLSNIDVSDFVGGVSVSGTTIPVLSPGASDTTSFTGSYVITQADIDAGFFDNSAQVAGFDSNGGPIVNTDDEHVILPQDPHLTIEKSGAWSDGDGFFVGYAHPGELVNYTVTVTNDGNVTLHDLAVTDPLVTFTRGADLVGDNDNIFNVGEIWSYSGSYAINQADIDAGNVHNEATASALGPQDQSATDSDDNDAALPQFPSLIVDKEGVWVDGDNDGFAEGWRADQLHDNRPQRRKRHALRRDLE